MDGWISDGWIDRWVRDGWIDRWVRDWWMDNGQMETGPTYPP